MLICTRDWLEESVINRPPEDAPYAFSGFYLWRDRPKGKSGIVGADAIHSDRFRLWGAPGAAASEAMAQWTFWRTMPPLGAARAECQAVLDAYGRAAGVEPGRCVGYAIACNRSNGYPYGIFYVAD